MKKIFKKMNTILKKKMKKNMKKILKKVLKKNKIYKNLI